MTDPSRHRQLMDIFDRASELAAHEQPAFLNQACGQDRALRREIECMLRHDALERGVVEAAVAGGALDALAREMATTGKSHAADTPQIPESIGSYRILRILGEGGMGVVYLAEQENPKRQIALKVIRRSTANAARLRRFELEAGLLGRLHHPGIAQVYEAGVADSGDGPQPFIAMELVNGVSVMEYASSHRLTVRQRLALIARIADAVQHAHQRGVIHRDLKPANILVIETDGSGDATSLSTHFDLRVGQPKVLDFGVARAMDVELQVTTLQTNVGQLIGTLPYMSPEQVAADPDQIDTRSDVYALGVMLYQLLTDRLPHDIRGVAFAEAARVIHDDQPPRLSAIDRALRGDIETIAGKALEKEKERRYQSAADLAADIRRYLNHEPIVARPATALYQIRKFAQRNKTLVTALAMVFATLVIAIVFINGARLDARRGRDDALRQARITQAVNDFLNIGLLAQASPMLEFDREITVREVLDRAAERLDGQFEDPAVEAATRFVVGMTYRNLGEYALAAAHLQKALDLQQTSLGEHHPQSLETMIALGETRSWMGDLDQAEALLAQAMQRSRFAHRSNHGLQLQAALPIAALREMQSRFQDAEELYRTALSEHTAALGDEHISVLAARNGLAMLYDSLGRLREAEPLYLRNLEALRRSKGDNHPDTIVTVNNLGALYYQLGNLDEADRYMTRALDVYRESLGESHPQTIVALGNLGSLRMEQGQLDEAEKLMKRASDLNTQRFGEKHVSTLTAMNNVANLLQRQSKSTEAEELYARTYDACRQALGDEHLQTIVARLGLAKLYSESDRLREAEAHARACHAWTSSNLAPDSRFSQRAAALITQIEQQLRSAGESERDVSRETIPE